jgi:hypothetical protein
MKSAQQEQEGLKIEPINYSEGFILLQLMWLFPALGKKSILYID